MRFICGVEEVIEETWLSVWRTHTKVPLRSYSSGFPISR